MSYSLNVKRQRQLVKQFRIKFSNNTSLILNLIVKSPLIYSKIPIQNDDPKRLIVIICKYLCFTKDFNKLCHNLQ
jgi:hypothetical protein